MTVPSELPDIGSTSQRLRQNPRFDPVKAGVGPEEYFVWTRFDGATTLKDLILMTGFAVPKAVEIVRKLRGVGAVLLPNETPEQLAKARAAAAPAPSPPPPITAPPVRRTGGMSAQRTPTLEELPTTRVLAKDLSPDTATGRQPPLTIAELSDAMLTPEERAALAEDVDVAPEDRRRILAMHRRIGSGDAAAILGVADGTDRKAIKRAYFSLSKEFHPDRFYGKRLGSFAARLTLIFEEAAASYGILTGERQRRPSPPQHGRGAAPAAAASSTAAATKAASPADYAAELFDRACQTEVSGDLPGALRLFASALLIDAPARYLRRAARCALAAQEVRVALEYARKAANLEPSDPSTARVLAAAFKASGKLEQAEEVLVMALMAPNENDQLMHELQHDLAQLRGRSRST